METKNVMIVGVGGQGSLLASKLLGKLLTAEGYDVKVSEVHGMSQRGGSVVTYVRFGDKPLAIAFAVLAAMILSTLRPRRPQGTAAVEAEILA